MNSINSKNIFYQIKVLYRILSRKQRIGLWILQIVLILTSIMEFVGIGSIVPYIGIVSNPKIVESSSLLIYLRDLTGFIQIKEFIFFLGICTILLVVFGNLFSMLSVYLTLMFGHRVGQEWTCRLFSYYMRKDYLYHTRNNTAQLTSNVVIEVGRVLHGMLLPILSANAKISLLIILLISSFLYNPFVSALIILLLSLFYCFLYFIVRHKLFEYGAIVSSLTAKRFRFINEGLGGIKENIILGTVDFYIQRFKNTRRKFANAQIMKEFINKAPRYIIEIIIFGGVISVILYSFYYRSTEFIDILPQLTFFVIIGYKVIPSTQTIFQSVAQARNSQKPMEIVSNDLLMAGEKKEKSDDTISIVPEEKIELKNIYFKYDEPNHNIFSDLNLKIVPGSTIGFAGPTGSGKTTLVDLFLGLISPQEGALLVDGVKITKENLRTWQNSLGYVPQNIFLQDGSIKENIAYGISDSEIDMDRVWKAIIQAQLNRFISTLPDGVDTKVGERGVQLSGGQRQRIGIARALYRNASVLVLDEATSALDGETETGLLNVLYSLKKSMTLLLIAHRLSTLKDCDQIYVLDQGKLITSGTYDDLLTNCDLFQRMAKTYSEN